MLSLFALLLCLCLSCIPIKRETKDLDPAFLPEQYTFRVETFNNEKQWWQSFQSECLNGLVAESFEQNVTIRTLQARLRQANAQALKAGAALKPVLTGTADAAVSRRHGETTGYRTKGAQNLEAGFLAGYEVDLWGRLEASRSAAQSNVLASQEDLNAAAVTVAAEVTQHWLQIISQRRQYELLQQQLESNNTLYELLELRFQKGLATALDLYQQKQLIDDIRSQMPLVKQQERLLIDELAFLVGRTPYQAPVISDIELPQIANEQPAGIPADLLRNRPDVLAALRRLDAAQWQVAAAKAELLPSLRLTGAASVAHDQFNRLFDNWLLNLAAGLSAPLLDGGKRRLEVERVRFAAEEQFESLKGVLLRSISEVEAALIRENSIREHLQGLRRQHETAQKALSEAQYHYLNGLRDYLPVLNQLISIQGLERELIQRQTDLLIARIALYRALGGTWMQDAVNGTNPDSDA